MVNGDFVAHGSMQELINQNASGYQMELSLAKMKPEEGKIM